jgi:non-ribosomal peptide synthetase component E (peptide arylation enzyme)
MHLTEAELVKRPDSRLTADDVRRYYDSGQWRRKTLSDYLDEAAAAQPSAVALMAARVLISISSV